MATELGKAYVQIMPSAKGISGSIQDVINPEATAAGKSAGRNIAASISSALGSAGKTLTKSITVPAMAAATAVSGVVAALGWKRLVAVDAAQAQLKGLGYSAEDVSRISEGLREAITGGMLTMAEATSAAATAMAAGVKEGDELTRYIKLLDSAVVGGTGTFGEMEQIFGRVVDQGKLTRTEFDMIAQRMPGFSAAVQSHMGIGSEAMYEMLRNGEITTDDFLDVMEGFAGGMADAYADSWSGMVQNTLANVGIIGESILGGVFEQSKESIAEFLDYLRSDDLKAWAKETGAVIGQAFSSLVDNIKSAIQWWTNLDGSTQKLLLTIGAIAVAIGPVLMIISKLITVVMTVHRWFGLIKIAAGVVSTAIGAISTPVLVVIGVIAGLIALFTALYHKNEGFRDLVQSAWTAIKDAIMTAVQIVSDFVMEIFGGLVAWWNENNELIKQTIQTVWSTIQNIIVGTLNFLMPLIKAAWDVIKIATTTVWNVIKVAIDTVLKVITGIMKAMMQIISGDWKGAWQTIKNTVMNLLTGVKNTISNLLTGAFNIIKSILGHIKSRFSDVFGGLKTTVTNAFRSVKDAVKTGINKALDIVKNIKDKFFDAGKNIVSSIADGIKGAIGDVTGAISGVASKVRNFLPFSPAKEGPLKDLDKLNFGGTISMGIDDGASEVQKAMESMLTFNAPHRSAMYSSGFDDSQNVTGLLNELIQAVRENKDVFIDGEKVTGRVNEVNAINALGGYMD